MKRPTWIEEEDVLALHERLLALHGGAPGIRDRGLLQSALARPRQHFAYDAQPNLINLAAVYTVGIVKNHPFLDGNKRTGFVVGVMFLELNGYRFIASEEEAAQAVLSVAAGKMREEAYTAFLRANVARIRK